jgi:hypothetical protein
MGRQGRRRSGPSGADLAVAAKSETVKARPFRTRLIDDVVGMAAPPR